MVRLIRWGATIRDGRGRVVCADTIVHAQWEALAVESALRTFREGREGCKLPKVSGAPIHVMGGKSWGLAPFREGRAWRRGWTLTLRGLDTVWIWLAGESRWVNRGVGAYDWAATMRANGSIVRIQAHAPEEAPKHARA